MKKKTVTKPSAEALAELKQRQEQELKQLQEHWIKKRNFILKHGRIFPRTGPSPSRYRMPEAQLKMCYQNAFTLALRFHDELAYAEGVAIVGGIPGTDHAWCVDLDGNVIDPTWKYDKTQGYQGVPFDLKYVCRMFNKHSTQYPLLNLVTPDSPLYVKHTKWKTNIKRLRKMATK
jgi:hypothetical protein